MYFAANVFLKLVGAATVAVNIATIAAAGTTLEARQGVVCDNFLKTCSTLR